LHTKTDERRFTKFVDSSVTRDWHHFVWHFDSGLSLGSSF